MTKRFYYEVEDGVVQVYCYVTCSKTQSFDVHLGTVLDPNSQNPLFQFQDTIYTTGMLSDLVSILKNKKWEE